MEFVNDDAIATIRIDRAKVIFEKGNQVDVFMSSLAKIVKLQNKAAGLSYDGQGAERKDPQHIHVMNSEWGAGQLFATNNFIGTHSATTKDREIFSKRLDRTDWGMLHESGHTYQIALLGMFLTLPRTFGYDFYPILNQSYRSSSPISFISHK